MTVERRYDKRFPVEFNLSYSFRDQHVDISRAQDISARGMRLETDQEIPPRGMLVELHISIGGRTWDIPAVVTHSSPRQMGVMFHDAQPVLCRMAATPMAS